MIKRHLRPRLAPKSLYTIEQDFGTVIEAANYLSSSVPHARRMVRSRAKIDPEMEEIGGRWRVRINVFGTPDDHVLAKLSV